MKIICIGRNYTEHIQELKNETPDEPVIFLKPDTALLLNNDPFFYPDFTNDLHYEVEVLVKIKKGGKNIEPEFASRYYDMVGLGIDFTARDLQNKLKAKGLPWEKSKAFNHSAVVSPFYPLSEFGSIDNLNFRLEVNGEKRQDSNTNLMIHSINSMIVHISQYFTLKLGDIIFSGTPAGVSAAAKGDRVRGFLQDRLMFDFNVK